MGAAGSLEASPPSTPEQHQRGTEERHARMSPSPARLAERRPPPRPEPAREVSRAATLRPPAPARHASPQCVAWGAPPSARSRTTSHDSRISKHTAAYRKELLPKSHSGRPASEYAAADAEALSSPSRLRLGGPELTKWRCDMELRLTRQQMRHCIALRRMLAAQVERHGEPQPKPPP